MFALITAIAVLIAGCAQNTGRIGTGITPNEPGPGELVLVPAGEFQMGSSYGQFYADESPLHQVLLDAYYVGVSEVTNAEYAQFLSESFDDAEHYHLDMDILRQGDGYLAKSGLDDYPVRYVSWFDAKAYAEWASGRLPTEAEWEKAARGNLDTRLFPWGDHISYGQANYYSNSLWKVGTATGVSPYGCMDMAGNVWEWTADWYDASYYSISPYKNPSGPRIGDVRVIRGGGYLTENELQLRCAARFNADPDGRYSDLGFRIVVDSLDYEG